MIHRLTNGGEAVSELFLLSESQMERISPFFPLAHGVPRVDDRRVLSGIVYVIRTRLCITGSFAGAAWVSLTGSLSP